MRNGIVYVLIILFSLSSSCTKKKQKIAWQDEYNDVTKLAILGNSDARLVFDEILRIGDPCIANPTEIFGNCVTISLDTMTNYAGIYTFDYGSGCVDGRGSTKTGKIIVRVSKHFYNGDYIEARRELEFVDFYLNGVQITGFIYLDWFDENPNHDYFKLTMDFNYPLSGQQYDFHQESYITWNGSTTCETADDEFNFTDEVNNSIYIEREGNEYKTIKVESAIIWKENVNYPYKGSLMSGKDKYGTTATLGLGDNHDLATITTFYKPKELTVNLKTRAFQ